MSSNHKVLILLLAAVVLLLFDGVAVGVSTDQAELEQLIEDLISSNFRISTLASNALVELGEEVIPAVGKVVLENSAWDNRYKAITVLRRIGSAEGIPILLNALTDSEDRVRSHARTSLEEIVAQSDQVKVIELVEPYLVANNLNLRIIAADLLSAAGWESEDFANVFIKSLSASDPIIRAIALERLGEIAHQEAAYFAEVSPLVYDSHIAVQKEAVRTLVKLGFTSEQIVELVFAGFMSGQLDKNVVPELLGQMVLGELKNAKALIDVITNTQNSKEWRQLAFAALDLVVPEMEYHLERGLVAIKAAEGVYLSWRLLGTEPYDLAFNVYRDGQKINDQPITSSTNYQDPLGTLNSKYQVKAVIADQEVSSSKEVTVWEKDYLAIPLQKPEGGITPDGVAYNYRANDASAADLDGDGEYEIILKWDPSNSKDNSQSGYTGNVYIDAYKLDGTFMWRIDLGRNIRAGAHYTQFMVYDLDGDGRAELVMKTADGTVDGLGNVIGDPSADHRNSSGYILSGPEYLTVFDGLTGAALATIDYEPPRGNVSAWGDNYGNRVDRFLAGIAYLDGVRPSVIMARGYYTRTVIVAYNWRDGKLEHLWTFDSAHPGYQAYAGQGNHQLSIADVNNDGRDEIIYGAMTINHDGTPLYNTGLGHGDALHVGDFDPERPGLEVFGVHENYPNPAGVNLRDARTGEVIWGIATDYDVGRGLSANVDPNHPGNEVWASRTPLFNAKGEVISNTAPSSINHAIWWTGDLLRELLDHDRSRGNVGKIDKWDWENQRTVNIATFEGTSSNNDTKGNPCLQADLFGDWREEVVFRAVDSSELRIYSTTYPTEHRLYTLMHDRMYRVAIAWQNVAYNQPPHPSFYIGPDMERQEFNIGNAYTVLEQYGDELSKW
ncbi:MAG: hypothetical protein GX208_01340 [Firmicutes bacterium]|nr:hypothetical protein [Bacillota bacterium]